MNNFNDLSKSELFDLAPGFCYDSSQIDEESSLDLSNFDFSVIFFQDSFKLKEVKNLNIINQSDLEPVKVKPKQNRRQNIEIKQLQHDLQLAKIELAQREFQQNNLKIEYTNRCEGLQEKCDDLNHQNQILRARLESINAVKNKIKIKIKIKKKIKN